MFYKRWGQQRSPVSIREVSNECGCGGAVFIAALLVNGRDEIVAGRLCVFVAFCFC